MPLELLDGNRGGTRAVEQNVPGRGHECKKVMALNPGSEFGQRETEVSIR